MATHGRLLFLVFYVHYYSMDVVGGWWWRGGCLCVAIEQAENACEIIGVYMKSCDSAKEDECSASPTGLREPRSTT